MASYLATWRIPLALVFATVFIVGAYVAAVRTGQPSVANASTETDILEKLASKDSDRDGLTDWEESLYGTDPHLLDSKGLGMSDSEAVGKGLIVPDATVEIPAREGELITEVGVPAPAPDSLTAAFARKFFVLFLQAKQAKGTLSETDRAAIAQQAFDELLHSVTPVSDFKSTSDLTVAGSGPATLRAFAVSAENVFRAHPNNAPKSELLYLQDAVELDDKAAVAQIISLAQTYHEVATGLAVLTVPTELQADYLLLVNVLERLSKLSSDFARVETDPLATMLALYQYPDAILKMGTAFIHIHEIYKAAGIELVRGEPGSYFVNVIPTVAAEQKAAKDAAQ